jgi:hypothetical protein
MRYKVFSETGVTLSVKVRTAGESEKPGSISLVWNGKKGGVPACCRGGEWGTPGKITGPDGDGPVTVMGEN